MACQTVECKGNCTCCTKSLKIFSMAVSLTADTMDIMIPETKLSECQKICIFLEQPFPVGSFNAKINVLNAPDTLPVVTKCGRNVHITTPGAFSILRCRYFEDPKRLQFCQFGIRTSEC